MRAASTHLAPIRFTSLKRHAATIYFALVFVVSYSAVILAVGPSNFPPSGEEFADLSALVYLAIIAGPTVACVIAIAISDGAQGFHDLRDRLLRWRVGARWYLVALAPAAAMIAMSLLLSAIWPALRPAFFDSPAKSKLLIDAALPSLFIGAFEEVGWTGFAAPHLRTRHSVLATGLTIGVVWGTWHLPLFWDPDPATGLIPFSILLARGFGWLPPLRVLMVRVHDACRSIPVLMLMHALVSFVSIVLAPTGLTGARLLAIPLATGATMWLLVAVARGWGFGTSSLNY